MIIVGLAILGAILGSFLNVVIYRLPRGESLARPGSHCAACGIPLRAWQNIPIISYILLRGRCRACGMAIPVRYLLVELLTPATICVLFLYFGPTWESVKFGIFALFLIPIVFIDLDHRLILNKLTLPGLVLGLGFSIMMDPTHFYQPLIGALAGGGLLWLVAVLGSAIYSKESMGGGDIKFGAMVGAFTSPEVVLLALFLAFFAAAVFAIFGMISGWLERRSVIPFGPFIALGAMVSILLKNEIIHFYLTVFA